MALNVASPAAEGSSRAHASMARWTAKPMNKSSSVVCFIPHLGLNEFHSIPIVPDDNMTAIPIHMPLPPNEKRYAPVISMANKVGTGPKNKPEIESNTERTSKTIPGIIFHGLSIKMIPNTPMIKPARILNKRLFELSYRDQI